jgi:uroporphyrinogen decarboxylase
MTSRERILATIAHKQTGRVPVDLGATPCPGISAIAYSNLVQNIGINDLRVKINDVVQQLVHPDDDILELYDVEVLFLIKFITFFLMFRPGI